MEGFHDFMRPRRLSTLLGAASKGPVVILNASTAGCDALLLTSAGVQHIPLAVTFDQVTQLVKHLKTVTLSGSRDQSEPPHAHIEGLLQQMPPLSTTSQQLFRQAVARGAITRVSWSDLVFQDVLATLWTSVIDPVIHVLELKV